MKTFQISALGLMILLAASPSADGAEANLLSRSRDTITTDELRQHVETLADDAFEGREAGKAGGRAAATYIMRSLKALGVRPAGVDGTFFQPFDAGCRNIIGMVRGTHSKLRNEFIIVSAHYDHVGFGSKRTSNGPVGAIHNGADDNASGVATTLEVADALMQYRGELKRSVLFVFWDGEEQGLWGSKHWLQNPTIDPEDVRLMVNIDMVGRLRETLGLYGTLSMPGLRYAWSKANVTGEIAIDFPWQVYDNSDHFVFFKRGIPVTMVHTGLHDDYHTPSDDVHRLDYRGIHQIADLVLNFTVQMANREAFPDFRHASLSATAGDQAKYELPYQVTQRRLGIALGSRGSGTNIIDSVVLGSMADRLGIRPGDRILQIDGQPPTTIAAVREQLASDATALRLLLESSQTKREMTIPPVRKPRVGISWRTNTAEPNAVTVSGIVQGSHADRAGLKVLDRIHEINGQRILESNDFRDRMSTAEGETELLIERSGKLALIKLDIQD